MRNMLRALTITSALLFSATAASAAPITFDFSVRVSAIGGIATTLFPTLAIGDTITGRYVSDTSIPDGSLLNTSFGTYEYLPGAGAPFDTFVDIKGQQISWTGSRIAVTNTAAFDVYIFESSGAVSLLPGLTTAKFAGQLNGGGGAQFTNDLFPLTAPNAALFGTTFTLRLGPDSGPDKISGVVTSISAGSTAPTPVPEPASLLLLGTGLVAVGRRAKRSLQATR
jgi:hypothetical protein